MFNITGNSMMFFGVLFTMLIWFLLVAGLFLVINWILRDHLKCCEDKYLNILKERYARGEINKKQFESMKKELSK